jgi:hypothetical protein
MRLSRRAPRPLWLTLAVLLLALLGGAAPAGAGGSPRLGRAFHPGLSGFGQARPRQVFLGGDPTGLVQRIHWSSWGAARAIGAGEAEYDWPGTSVAANPIAPGARIVAFHLGSCHGVRSYNAVEWYFPKDGGAFDPHEYIDTCTGSFVGVPRPVSCPDVALADGAGRATLVIVSGISCASAATFVAAVPVSSYLPKGGRFIDDGFRCGSEGTASAGGSASFACQSGASEVAFFVEP